MTTQHTGVSPGSVILTWVVIGVVAFCLGVFVGVLL
jgi:hypothetical protein